MVKALNRYEVEAVRNYYRSLSSHKDDDDDTSTVLIPNEKIVEVPIILGY